MLVMAKHFQLQILFSTVILVLVSIVKSDDANGTEDLQIKQQPSTTNQDDNRSKIQETCNINLYKIHGNVYSLQHDDLLSMRMSLMNTKILVNHGQYIAYPKDDGSFEVNNLPSDSYVVEAVHPKYIYEPYRVDITSKGKIRARRVNYMQPSLVQTVDYPIQFKPKSLHNYFMPRETWRIMDLLLNPMVIMMVAPLAIIWVLPKMMSPQEVQTQRDSVQVPEYNVPELSEMMANMFNRGGQQQGCSNPTTSGGGQAITAGSGASGAGRKAKRR